LADRRKCHQYPRPVAKPDLIELSTDWDNALLVADRYTGLDDNHVIEQSKRTLAALLLIANKEGRDYGWVSDALLDYKFVLAAIQNGGQPDTAVAVEVLRGDFLRGPRQRGDICSRAYVLFLKALQPRSAFDLDVLPDPAWIPTGRQPDSYG
jgi:hypothetical protein